MNDKIVETVHVTLNGETRKAELRELEIKSVDGKPLYAIWYAGDETGEFKQQMTGKETKIMPVWDKIKSMV